jgi:putative nucleotidyltransferase with HDIG domain
MISSSCLPDVQPLAPAAIAALVSECTRLPALSITSATLRALLTDDDNSDMQQIADVIRHDPSLATRVLQLVNSVYYALPQRVKTIEEAVFYLGIRQVRQLATVTPIIDQLESLTSGVQFPWRQFWQHCIGTAMLANELVTLIATPEDELAYLAGLLHDVGKIVIAATLPQHFNAVRQLVDAGETDLLALERQLIGVDHAEIGALYLTAQGVPEPLIAAARWHHQPESAKGDLAAPVQIADLLVRHAGIGNSGNRAPVSRQECLLVSGWSLLFSGSSAEQRALARASIERSVARLPVILEGLV